jgi:hypothetical protein
MRASGGSLICSQALPSGRRAGAPTCAIPAWLARAGAARPSESLAMRYNSDGGEGEGGGNDNNNNKDDHHGGLPIGQ